MAIYVKRFPHVYRSWRLSVPGSSRRYCHGFSGDDIRSHLPIEEVTSGRFSPWLMFPDVDEGRHTRRSGGRTHQCYSFSSGGAFTLPTPQLQGRKCFGTPYGWLFTLNTTRIDDNECADMTSIRQKTWLHIEVDNECTDTSISLYNPLTHQQLSLPSQSTFKFTSDETADSQMTWWFYWWYQRKILTGGRLFINKFYISKNPAADSSSDHSPPVIMSIYADFSHLAFASPGDQTWKPIECERGNLFTDIIFYKGHFYSINILGELSICDISTAEPKLKPIASFHKIICKDYGRDLPRYTKLYLIEISGDLYLIHKRNVSFDVYKVDLDKASLTNVEDLNGHALFVGGNTSFAVSTVDYPQIKPNSIYFTDDDNGFHSIDSAMGIYDFGSRTLVSPFQVPRDSLHLIWPPFFFIPSLPNRISV